MCQEESPLLSCLDINGETNHVSPYDDTFTSFPLPLKKDFFCLRKIGFAAAGQNIMIYVEKLFEYEPKITPLASMRGAGSQPSGVTDRTSPTDFPQDPNLVPG